MLRGPGLLTPLAILAALVAAALPVQSLLAQSFETAIPEALPLDASDLGRVAQAITVRLEGAVIGSGVIVDRRGTTYTVLTAWHVVRANRPGEEFAVITADGFSHSLDPSSVQALPGVDLAVLRFRSDRSYAVARFGRAEALALGAPLAVAGFPMLDRGEGRQPLRLKLGQLEALLPVPQEEGYQLLYSNATLPGMSGGPVLNRQGQLVGLHGRAELHSEASRRLGKPVASSTNMGLSIAPYLALVPPSAPSRDQQPTPRAGAERPERRESVPMAVLESSGLARLEQALAGGRFRQGDGLTRDLLLTEPGQSGWLTADSVGRLRCSLLLAVDDAWSRHSLDRFGFSVQRRLWPGDFSGFSALAGWRRGGFVQYAQGDASNLPQGYYPRLVADGPIVQVLLDRFGRCQAERPSGSR